MSERKWKEDKESELLIRVIRERFIGEDGKQYIKVEWIKAEEPINLGSIAKPNKDIIEIQYRFPKNIELLDFFKNLFGGIK